MNKEEIIEMARQAGFERLGHTAEDWVCHLEDIEEFTKLVAEHEREAFTAHAITSAEKAIDVAIKLERNACAEICDGFYFTWINIQGRYEFMGEGASECAGAIRARGQE